mgnify:CR=1 FL=1
MHNGKNIRTDLAIEAQEFIKEQSFKDTGAQTENIPGVEVQTEGEKDIKVTRVRILNDEGEKAIGKPKGHYITLEIARLNESDQDLYEDSCRALAKEINNIINIDKKATVLIAGLGNWKVTPDSLGPKVISNIMVTRHLIEYVPEQIDDRVRPVCAVSPGVLGITGVETGEIIKGIVEKIKPDLIIAIDSLASRKMDRVNKTIQISDTGISPGSGVGNKRMELSEKTMGVPVVAIGIPTVVDAATMANDTIELVIDNLIKHSDKESDFYKMLKELDSTSKYQLIQEVLNPYVGNLIVTPKEIDEIVKKIALVVSNGINIALHEGVQLDDVNRYLN